MSSVAQTQETASSTEAQAFYDRLFGEIESRLDRASADNYRDLLSLDAMVCAVTETVTRYVYLALPDNDDVDVEMDYWNWMFPDVDGPAARLAVEVDDWEVIQSARLEYRDETGAWTPAPKQDAEVVKRLACLIGNDDD